VPTVNGKTQLPGSQFRATEVVYKPGKSSVQFSLDMAKAYPEEAGIVSLKRTVKLNREKNVTVEDIINTREAGTVTQHLMTCYPAEVIKPGELVIHYKSTDGNMKNFKVRYDKNQLGAVVEKVSLTEPEDRGIMTKWGDTIYRISFKSAAAKTADKFSLVIAPE
jgi:hypothetical protein